MRFLLQNLGNLFTLLNLAVGFVAVININRFSDFTVALLVAVAGLFDVFDGALSRRFGGDKNVGAQLDSLADMVTFGVLPAAVVFNQIFNLSGNHYLAALSLLIVFGAAIRLAKFNVSGAKHDYFIGLPTPANTLLIVFAPLLILNLGLNNNQNLLWVWVFLSLASLYLQIAGVKLLSFKNNTKQKWLYWLMVLVVSMGLYYFVQLGAVTLTIFVYIIASVFYYKIQLKKQ